jgi:signal transduction histidine kinase
MASSSFPGSVTVQQASAPRVWRARAAAGLMAAVLGLGIWLQLLTARDAAITAAETMVSALTKAIAERVDGSLRAVDSLLNEAVALRAGGRDDQEMAQRILGRLEQFPEVRYIGMITPAGRLTGPTWPQISLPEGGLDVSEREYFKQMSAVKPPPSLVMGHPVSGRATGQRSIHIVRPIQGGEGDFAGAVMASFNPDSWAKFLETVMVDPEGATAVIHLDGQMVARAPDHEAKFGIDIHDSDLFRVSIPRSRSGVTRLVSKADGNRKFLAYRVLDHYPLVVTSGISAAVALHDWRRMAAMEIAAAVALLAVVFYWAWRSDRSAAQMLAYGQRLAAAVEMRTAELAAAHDAVDLNARRLHKVNVELQRMAMVTAHHLQEPLRPMVSYSQLLEQRLRGRDAEADDMLVFIRNAAVRLKALLRDFQRYVAALTDQPDIKPIDVGRCVRGAAQAVERQMGEGVLNAVWPELPTVNADPALLRDLFRELLSNAVIHRNRQEAVNVRIECAGETDGWVFRVVDDGVGIAPSMRERVFQVFETAVGRSADSTGLGLPLCRLIIEAHGGDMMIEPSDVGTVVRFRLPLLPTPTSAMRAV